MVVAPQHGHEGIGHAEVGILTDADDGEQLVLGAVDVVGSVDVEVVAVVEVAIRRSDEPHGLGDLMDRVVVKRGEHGGSSIALGHVGSCRCPARV